jgi:hypothetical protein
MSDSLDTVENADAYFATRSNTQAWDTLDTEAKQNYLNDATRYLNTLGYIGVKTDSAQLNEWPRYGVIENGVILDKTVIPTQILQALYEIAFALARGIDPERELNRATVTSRGFASVRTTYDPGRTPEHVLYGCPSAMAWLYLLPYLERGQNGVVRLHRVN